MILKVSDFAQFVLATFAALIAVFIIHLTIVALAAQPH